MSSGWSRRGSWPGRNLPSDGLTQGGDYDDARAAPASGPYSGPARRGPRRSPLGAISSQGSNGAGHVVDHSRLLGVVGLRTGSDIPSRRRSYASGSGARFAQVETAWNQQGAQVGQYLVQEHDAGRTHCRSRQPVEFVPSAARERRRRSR